MTTTDLRPGRLAVTVVIPLKWSGGAGETYRVEEMGRYLEGLRQAVAEVLVVDGSDEPVRRRHEEAWGRFARLLRPDASAADQAVGSTMRRAGGGDATKGRRNGKVLGALTGIQAARNELVVLADDDIRHTPRTIARLVQALHDADLVRPVNVFDAWPWHARWDGARMLLNVVLASDWPGTFALRRSTVLACGGWSADVLFENLELWRTVEAAGGRTVTRTDVVVWRKPPTTGQFWAQRRRQAYDDLAQPARLLVELAIVPALLLAGRRGPRAVGALVVAVVLVAARGRSRVGAAHVPPSVPLWAPLWVLERGVCTWIALGHWARGGVPYHGQRLRVAAHSASGLRRRLGAVPGTVPSITPRAGKPAPHTRYSELFPSLRNVNAWAGRWVPDRQQHGLAGPLEKTGRPAPATMEGNQKP